MKKTERKITGWNYINLALTAFGGLGLEALYAYLLEPIIYGAQMSDWTENQMICHWIITCITWGIMAFLLCRSSKKKYEFDLWAKGERVRAWQWIAVLCCVAVTIATSIINWNGFKVILEYQHNGALKFIFQYIYYFFETALFTLIIVFAQKAFETWFKRKNIPYGGIICAVTWGAAHIFTKGSVTIGLLSALCGFLYGTVYLLLGRDIKKTYVALAVMFML
ncbi:MAG: hypothetical protein ACI4IJ_05095 [Acutalibacteraceae bacterium]